MGPNRAGTGLELRFVEQLDDGSLNVRESLETIGRGKLAKNQRGDRRRQELAVELGRLGGVFSNMSPEQRDARAATKYAYINAKGNEAHHILPISYMGKVLQKLQEQGIEGPVIDELVRRKMSVGDTAANLASLATKSTQAGRRDFLKPIDKTGVVDTHDQVHAMSEELLEQTGLPRQNKGTYRLEQFMDDPSKTAYQKQAYAMAIPQAHRLAVQAVLLDPTTEANQKRLLDGAFRLAADTAQADMKLSPLSQRMLRKVHGQRF